MLPGIPCLLGGEGRKERMMVILSACSWNECPSSQHSPRQTTVSMLHCSLEAVEKRVVMAGKWDSPLKRLVEDYPQDFVSWLLQQATFERVLKTELSHRIIHADMLLEVTKQGQRCALHLEFQAESDPQMAKRLWEYTVRATLQYGCPVYS
jgi:hypothetical protein